MQAAVESSTSGATAEVVCFDGLIQELVAKTIDGKANSKANHMEQNILKGLNCDVTMTEPVTLALYGASVSWPLKKDYVLGGRFDERVGGWGV